MSINSSVGRWMVPTVVIGSLLLGCVSWSLGDEGKPAATQPSGHSRPGQHEEALEHFMEGMGKALKPLSKQIGDPSRNESSLELVGRMVVLASQAKLEVPPGADKLSGQEKSDFVKGYREAITDLIRALSDVDDALVEDKNDDAAKALEKVVQVMKDGHKSYRPKKQEEKH